MDEIQIKNAFGQNIRALRLNKKISQEKLGELTGLHRTYIGSIERGERNPSLLNIVKISHALEQDIITLFDGIK